MCVCVCVCVCACVRECVLACVRARKLLLGNCCSQESLSSNTVTDLDMRMHHVLIILTLTFIQGHTDRNYENNNCLIISKTIQAMTITFAVKIVRLRVYMTIASPVTLIFVQGHKFASNLATV